MTCAGLPWFEHLSYSRARPDLPWEGFSHKGKDEVAEQDEQENSDDWNLHDELLSTNVSFPCMLSPASALPLGVVR